VFSASLLRSKTIQKIMTYTMGGDAILDLIILYTSLSSSKSFNYVLHARQTIDDKGDRLSFVDSTVRKGGVVGSFD
jgi:hypothetical protein